MKFSRERSDSLTHVVERVFHPMNEVSHQLVEQHHHRDDQPNVVDWPVGRCTIENFSFSPEITDRTRNARSKSSKCLIKKGSNQSIERSKVPRDWMQLIFHSLINKRSPRRLIPWTSLFLSRNWRIHFTRDPPCQDRRRTTHPAENDRLCLPELLSWNSSRELSQSMLDIRVSPSSTFEIPRRTSCWPPTVPSRVHRERSVCSELANDGRDFAPMIHVRDNRLSLEECLPSIDSIRGFKEILPSFNCFVMPVPVWTNALNCSS